MLATDAFIAMQPSGIRGAIETCCKGTTLDRLWNPEIIRDIARRHNLIWMLGMMDLPLWHIAAIAGVEPACARGILVARRKQEQRVKTMRWSA